MAVTGASATVGTALADIEGISYTVGQTVLVGVQGTALVTGVDLGASAMTELYTASSSGMTSQLFTYEPASSGTTDFTVTGGTPKAYACWLVNGITVTSGGNQGGGAGGPTTLANFAFLYPTGALFSSDSGETAGVEIYLNMGTFVFSSDVNEAWVDNSAWDFVDDVTGGLVSAAAVMSDAGNPPAFNGVNVLTNPGTSPTYSYIQRFYRLNFEEYVAPVRSFTRHRRNANDRPMRATALPFDLRNVRG